MQVSRLTFFKTGTETSIFADVKQIEWEEHRNRWLRGFDKAVGQNKSKHFGKKRKNQSKFENKKKKERNK